MKGNERRSLLDGDVLHRQYAARASFEEFLDRFTVKRESKKARSDKEQEKQPIVELLKQNKANDGYVKTEHKPLDNANEKKSDLLEKVNDKLCELALKMSSVSDQDETSPMELGWDNARLSWIPELNDTRASLSAEMEDDSVFLYDDEELLSLQSDYAMMVSNNGRHGNVLY